MGDDFIREVVRVVGSGGRGGSPPRKLCSLGTSQHIYAFLAHLSQRLKVSYCDHSLSVVIVVGVVRLSVHNL